MDDAQIASVVLNVLLGGMVVLSYIVFLWHRIYAYGAAQEETKKWLWSVFHSWFMFCVWCVFATLATLSYLGIFFWVVCRNDVDKWSDNMVQFTVYNTLFLFFSLLYAYLVFRVFGEAGSGVKTVISRLLVVGDLLLVAVFSILMTYSIVLEFGYKREFAFAAVLSIHCTLMDLILWGTSWFYSSTNNIHHNLKNTWMGAALDADPSTMGIFSRLRIRARDYGAV